MSDAEVRNARILSPGSSASGPSKYRNEYHSSWALIVGINDYKHMRSLKHAVNDATEVARLLAEKFGIKQDGDKERVFYLYGEQATKDAIETVLKKFRDQTEPDDRIIIYFAGHGLPHKYPNGDEEGFLVPVEGRTDDLDTCVSTQTLATTISRAAAKHAFCILDSCFGGLITQFRGMRGGETIRRDLMTRRARIALTAGKGDQLVNDSGIGEHSIFTHFLLKGLGGEAMDKTHDVLIGAELMSYVIAAVGNHTDAFQTPDSGPLPGHENGDFVFESTAARIPASIMEMLDDRRPREDQISGLAKLGDLLPPGNDEMRRCQREKLTWYLFNAHDRLREQAANSLGRLADPLALDALAQSLDEQNEAIASVRINVVRAVGQIESGQVVPHLIRVLDGDRDLEVQVVAATVLGELKDPKASEALCAALKMERATQVRIEAAKALTSLADPSTFKALVEALEKDGEAKVRSNAAKALGALKDQSAVYILSKKLLGDEKSEVRSAAAWALGQLSDVRGNAALIIGLDDTSSKVRVKAIQNLGNFIQSDFIECLAKALKDEDLEVRRETVRLLSRMKQPHVLRPLTEALNDKDAEVRQAAVEALGKTMLPEAYDPLMKALSDADVNVRRYAIQSLTDLGDSRASERLAQMLENKDEDPKVRLLAAKALGNLSATDAAEVLYNASRNDPDPETKLTAAVSLGNLQDRRALDGLIEALGSESAETRIDAVEAIYKANLWEAIPDMLELLRTDVDASVRLITVAILGAFGSSSAEQATKDLLEQIWLEDKDVEIKYAAAVSLGRLKDQNYYQKLLDCLKDKQKEPYIRAGCAAGLGFLGDKRATPELIDALGEPTEELQLSAIFALGELRDDSAVEPLSQLLLDCRKGPKLRKAAIEVLALFKTSQTLITLVEALANEKDADVLSSLIATLIELHDAKDDASCTKHLIDLLQTCDHPNVRQAAASALGVVGDKSAVRPLVDAIQDSNPAVAAWAITSLGKLEASNVLDDLKHVYRCKESLQVWVAWTTGRLRDDDVLSLFVI